MAIEGMQRIANEEGDFVGDPIDSQAELFRLQLITREFPPAGAHIAMEGRASNGAHYFCKNDTTGIPARMREALYSKFITHLGIPTPEFAAVEDEGTGETYFGSKRHQSTADDIERKRFLRTERRDEFNRHLPFPKKMLSQLYAVDLFIGNVDRSASNIILHREGPHSRRLCPIDFTLAKLGETPAEIFPVESTETVQVGRLLRKVHGFCDVSALEMVDHISVIPPEVFMGFFRDIPQDWIDVREREALNELWYGQGRHDRLQLLRVGLKDGRLL